MTSDERRELKAAMLVLLLLGFLFGLVCGAAYNEGKHR